ncbi:protein crumbs homolog 1 isoform X1 [Esox lucius]|uniref:protein crumbs homolog 1 isoform X1 n=1 Tax=Esox lucius TaxID=8010 RepID=UPI0014774C6A|nr:protein crumbs homolog 1 isoform X1 [Esox lucius]
MQWKNVSIQSSADRDKAKTMLRFNVCVWTVWLLYAGAVCEEDTGACELRPCHNSGVCQSHQDGYRCLCPRQSTDGPLYGGPNCTDALPGCDGNPCKNDGVCSPLFQDNQQAYTCSCRAGFTGSRCQTSTAFSFETSGYMHIETRLPSPEKTLNVTLSFRTDRPFGTLLQSRADDLLFTVELVQGRLRLSTRRGQRSGEPVVSELPLSAADGKWHTMEAWLGSEEDRSGLRLVQPACDEVGCARESAATRAPQPEQGDDLPEPGLVHRSLFLGGVGQGFGEGEAESADLAAYFLGCFRDVFVASRLVVPATPGDSLAQVNVTAGCGGQDECEDSPCQRRGQCVSRGWRRHICQCYRPYEGTVDCAEEYITAGFGDGDTASYAVFSLDDTLDSGSIAISMFVRTRTLSGLLLVMANSTSQYLHLWLDGGHVKVQAISSESLVGHRAVSDGHFHLVTVQLEGNLATLFHSAQRQGSIRVRPVAVQPGDMVYVGGLADQRDSGPFGGHLKGCVQDLRINRKRLQFFPIATPVASYQLEKLVDVTMGCSSDDVCTDNPCLNGGACYSMRDDFICICQPHTGGRLCEEVRWCELSPCPWTAACQPVANGFECVTNVTLRNDRTLSYRDNGKISRGLNTVLLSVRTRQTDATLLHAKRGSEFLTVSLQRSHLVLELQASGGQASHNVTIQSRTRLSDGHWHTVELSMEDPAQQISRWIAVLDGGKERGGGEHVMSEAPSGNLDFLREGADIFLGGLGPEAGGNLAGCLGPVQIGGLLLPYYEDTELSLPRPQDERFIMTHGGPSPQYGCWGASVCEPNPCLNQGACEDLFDTYLCTCPSDWTGPQCQNNADTCAVQPCVHGNCSVSGQGHVCSCEAGYTGARCEEDTDTCEDNGCGLGSTCLRGLVNYTCLCPRNMTGPLCNEKLPEVPWHISMISDPHLPVSVCPGDRWSYSCFNGGNCSKLDNACVCQPGFLGQWCEVDYDECVSNPCANGGHCHNLPNGFQCECGINFSGDQCTIDSSDFILYLALMQLQFMLQFMSYMILQIDDGPEMDQEGQQMDDN